MHDHARAWASILLAAVEDAAVGDVFRRDQRLEHRDVEVRSLSRARAAPERREDRAEGVCPGEDVGGLEIGDRRRGGALPLQVREPGVGVDDVSERGPVTPWARLPVARDRAVDEVRTDARERRIVVAEPGHDAGHEVLQHDVRRAGEVEHDRARLGMREVDRHTELAGVAPHEVGALVLPARLELERVTQKRHCARPDSSRGPTAG